MCVLGFKIQAKVLTALLCAMFCLHGYAQKRLIEEVKQDLRTQTLTVANYTSSLTKLTPALKDSTTCDDAEVWFIAGKICFDKYDKYQSLRSIGTRADDSDMCSALISGYDYMLKALSLDSVPERDKHGAVKIDKKTGQPRMHTTYSRDITKLLLEHHREYKYVGRVYYSTLQKFGEAYRAWEIYSSMPYDRRFAALQKSVRVAEIGEYRFYQGVSAKLDGNYANAMRAFGKALDAGYDKRDVYDYAIICAEHEQSDSIIAILAKDAHDRYGKDNPRYIRILCNVAIRNGKYDIANLVVDQAMSDYPDRAEYYGLKGVLLENQNGNIYESYTYFKRAVELDPEGAQTNYDMGRYYLNLALTQTDERKNLELQAQAKPYFERTLEKDPGNKAARSALKGIYYNLNDPKYERL